MDWSRGNSNWRENARIHARCITEWAFYLLNFGEIVNRNEVSTQTAELEAATSMSSQ
jgi:hypothetical protein